MRRLSSRMTFFYKRIFPAVWFGILAISLIASAANVLGHHTGTLPAPALIMPIVMAGFGFTLFKKLCWDLADEVFDGGTFLLVRRNRIEEKIDLRDIVNVSASVMVSPPRITLLLRQDSLLGKEITFSPPAALIPSTRSAVADELIQRVDTSS
jgi:hypothetical protein